MALYRTPQQSHPEPECAVQTIELWQPWDHDPFPGESVLVAEMVLALFGTLIDVVFFSSTIVYLISYWPDIHSSLNLRSKKLRKKNIVKLEV